MRSAVLLLLLALLAVLSVRAEHTPSDRSLGMASCFRQGIAASLARVQLNNNYVCKLNSQIGPLPGFDFDTFGPNHGYPIIQSEDRSFFETYYGTPEGGFVAVNRVNVSTYAAVGYYMANETFRLSFYLDDKGQLITSEPFTAQTYDATSRPWYVGALNSASGSFVTREPFKFSQVNLRVASSRQCLSEGGQLQIIAGSGVTLDTLTDMVLTSQSCPLFDSADGAVFVVNENGTLIMQNDVAIRDLDLAANATGLVGAAAQQAELFNEGDWSKQVSGEFSYNDESYEVLAFPIAGEMHSVDVSVWGFTIVTVTKTSPSGSAASLRSWIDLFL